MTKGKNFTVVSRDDRRKGETDWEKLRKLTDKEIEDSIASGGCFATTGAAVGASAVVAKPS